MTREEMDRVVNEHFGYEAADNLDGVLATFTDDVQHEMIGSPLGSLTGKQAIRPFYTELFGDIAGEAVKPVARWYGEDFLVDVTEWTGEMSDGRYFGLPGKSGHVTFRLLHVFELRDGLIARENVWSDVPTIAQQVQ